MAGSMTWAVASYSEKSMWSPRPHSSRFQYATSAAHAACIAVTCNAMSPGGISGSRPGKPDRLNTPPIANSVQSVATQSR